ncbi:MAG TPA: FHA domain-containing protein [Archangium sp.]|uniref:FHA domain-containing protein n=1 Tax=Archangium sp. TaxID=1872627 RepID=UPI002E34DAD7|nr:FHA domain-containing protein [Archangium sp.]HEX5746814.1 FHA domain-containing protein [Archangium sp.]
MRQPPAIPLARPGTRFASARGMHFEFEHMGTSTPFELPEGVHLLGGAAGDQVQLEGLPPGLLTLRIESHRLMVEATHPFTVGGVGVAPGVPRLVLPGEVVGLSEEMRLKVKAPDGDAEREMGTMAVLKHLLGDLEEPPPSRAASLQCLIGADVGRTFALAEASTELGRGKDMAVRLRDIAVSRRHARIRHHEGAFLLEDLDSPNGLFLNGKLVKTPTPLHEGDVIELGRTLLRFQAPMATPETETPPSPETTPTPAETPAPAEPALADETPAAPSGEDMPERPRVRWEAWLIGLGAALALVGLLATYALAP